MKAMLIFVLGLLITFGGVGGVETSLNNWQLVGSFLISCGGLLVMFVGAMLLQKNNTHDKFVDNSAFW